MSDRCDCGEPLLHYNDKSVQAQVEQLVDEHGFFAVVTVAGTGTYLVPRHYIALHGLKAWELRELAGRYGWQRVDQ